ncbi:uncharacterized protein LOC135498182 [Lineus longissimus]|uniref:uncharacterized protein LOC135498182 n=1 Tax=Lineus longissimus TaxID=88925 RepID=UPI002B4F7B60
MRLKVLLSKVKLGILVWVINLHSSEQLSTSQRSDIEHFISDLMTCKNNPGMSVSVIHGDDSLVDGYGVTNLRTNRKVDNRTIFCIGSITKGFTAAVLGMVLQKSNRWSWDTSISEILGHEFKLSDDFRTRYLTIKDILAHRSGVPGYFGGLLTGYTIDRKTLVSRLRYMSPTHHVHSKFIYNNHMYMLAGYVAEKIAGKTWEELVQEEIFNKLGMTSSTFVKDLGSRADIAKSHVSINGKLVEIDQKINSMVYPAGPAGSICTNSEDMTKWLRFQLNKSLLPSGERLMNQTMFDAMHTPQMPTPLTLGKKILKQPVFPIAEGRFAYDLGWGSGTYRDYHILLHSGELSGYMSSIWLIPDENIGIFTSTNGPVRLDTWDGLRVIHHYIADVLLGLEPWLNSTSACKFPDPWLSEFRRKSGADGTDDARKKRDVTYLPHARPMEDYVGTYGHLAFGNISIRLNEQDGKLHLYHGRFGNATMKKTSNFGEFDMKFVGDLMFVSVADGWKHTFKIRFSSTDGKKVDRLYAGFIEGSSPPEFQRDLHWLNSDQPLQSNLNTLYGPCQCCRNSGSNAQREYFFSISIYLLISFAVIILYCQ